MAQVLFNYYLKPICNFVVKGYYDHALEGYMQMTTELQRKYAVEEIEYNKEYELQTEKGHGRVRT